MKVFRITSISYGPYDSDHIHKQGYITSFVSALTPNDAIELVINKIYEKFADDLVVMNTRFQHSSNIMIKLNGEHEPNVLIMDVSLK